MDDESRVGNMIASLRAFMKREGHSKADVARALGVHRSRVTGWLEDKRTPSAEYAFKIQALLAREKRKEQRTRKKKEQVSR